MLTKDFHSIKSPHSIRTQIVWIRREKVKVDLNLIFKKKLKKELTKQKKICKKIFLFLRKS